MYSIIVYIFVVFFVLKNMNVFLKFFSFGLLLCTFVFVEKRGVTNFKLPKIEKYIGLHLV
jgi:hypothetical protein